MPIISARGCSLTFTEPNYTPSNRACMNGRLSTIVKFLTAPLLSRPAALRRLLLVVAIGWLPIKSAHGQVVTGTVRDNNGQPVSLAHVFAATDSSTAGLLIGTLTDTDGRYVLRAAGLRPRFLGVRRIGFRPEALTTLDWRDGDNVRRDVVLNALPYALAEENDVRQLWEQAAATIVARGALLRSYRFRVQESHHAKYPMIRADSTTARDTSYVAIPSATTSTPTPLLQHFATYRKPSLFRRTSTIALQSPSGDGLLIHPQFHQRFCLDDRAASGDGGLVEVRFRELDRKSDEIVLSGTIAFKAGIPGPTRITLSYALKGATVGNAEQIFRLENVDGTPFPFMSSHMLQMLDPRSQRLMLEVGVATRWSNFERVVK
jgi:hypothetical protein